MRREADLWPLANGLERGIVALVTATLVETELPPADAVLIAHYCCDSFPLVGLCGALLIGVAADTSDWLCARCVVLYGVHKGCPWHRDGCP